MLASVPTCPLGRTCLTSDQLARRLRKKVTWVRSRLHEQRIEPHIVAEHTHKGRKTRLYLPCAEEVLKREVENYPLAPEGWFTRNHLQTKLSVNWRQANKLLEDYFGQSQLMRDSGNRIFRYYPVDVWKKLVPDTPTEMVAA